MLSIPEARALIAQTVHVLPPLRVPLAQAHGRTLRESLIAEEDIPAFDRSAMDGYAIRAEDPATEFRIVCEIPAGTVPTRAIGPGECARIFTGSPIPDGATQVIVQEVAQRSGDAVTFSQRGKGSNIRSRGEDAREGSVLIERGTQLGAVELSLCAQLGKCAPLIAPRPRILHIATGSELVAPDEIPEAGKIRDSNSTLVAALAAEAGAEIAHQFRVGDDPAQLVGAISGTDIESWDMLLLSGGASVGDHDFGARTLRELGFSLHFTQLNLRPGKPLIFATRGRHLAFVIPGNPLSHLVCWHLVIRAALDMLAIGAIEFALVEAPLGGDVAMKGNPRETWWPARIAWENGGAKFLPLKWQSSGDLTGIIGLDALIRVPAGIAAVQPGETIGARLLRAAGM
jgi:molybdopterin molybdotransferase